MNLLQLTACFCFSFALVQTVLRSRSLSKIPKAHWSVSFSPFWILWARFNGRESTLVGKAHRIHGPLIRLGPREISINFVEGGLKLVYGSFEKHHWYRSFWNHGRPNMFTFENYIQHSERRRMLSRVYSKSFLLRSEILRAQNVAIIHDRLDSILSCSAKNNGVLNIFDVMLSVTMDIVTAYFFGMKNSSNFLLDLQERSQRLKQYQGRGKYSFYAQELQSFWRILASIGLHMTPMSVQNDTIRFENWVANMAEKSLRACRDVADKNDIIDRGVVVEELNKLCSTTFHEKHLAIASEMTDQTIAGHETSAIALTYLIHELSKNPCLQQSLHEEAAPLFRDRSPELPDFLTLDGLPFLHACTLEILRLYPPIMGAQARVTPKGGVMLGEMHIPGGTRVSARASCLHRNPHVYPDPDTFKPHRWLNTEGKIKEFSDAPDLHQWWWAFGSGGRMCLGNHFALHSIKIVAGFLYSSYNTSFIRSTNLTQTDSYIGGPQGNDLMIKLRFSE